MATLSVNEILQDVLDALVPSVPSLSMFSTDFSSATAVKDDQIIAHISGLPAVQSYDAAQGGFKNGAVGAETLLTDVPVTLDQFKHVPIKVSYLTQLASKKDLYREAVRNYAFVLGKYIVDYALGKAVAANFSQSITESIANTTLDTLENARTALNTKNASQFGRFGIVNSQFAASIQSDSRVASGDYYGQRNGSQGYRTFENIAGFERVVEYPSLPANAENLTGFFGDRRAVTVAARVPNVQDGASMLGIPSVANFATVTSPETGLSLLGIAWQEQGTFDVYVTVAILFGASAGSRGGAEGAVLDYAGLRVKSA